MAKKSRYLKSISTLNATDRPSFGSKSVNLSLISKAGYCVPDGFCVSTEAFKDHILHGKGDLENLSNSSAEYQRLRQTILKTPLKPEFEKELEEHLQFIDYSDSDLLAVRSSAVEEDISSRSFAGVYSTVLDVNGKNKILKGIKSCWASYVNETAQDYRFNQQIESLKGMAVIIQRMIQAKYSGVMFTNWLSNNRDQDCLIEMVSGDARNLVDGKVSGKRFSVNRKTMRVRSNNRKFVIKHFHLLKWLARIGLEIESIMGSPQDIEWCLDNQRKLWILQARPITDLPNVGETNKPRFNGWERANHEPFSTLGCYLAAKRHLYWVKAINHFYRFNFKPKVRVKDNIVFHSIPWERKTGLVRVWMLVLDAFRWLRRRHVLREYRCSTLPRYDQLLSDIRLKDISRMRNADLLSCFSQTISIYLDSQYTSFPVARIASLSAHMLEFFFRLIISKDETISAHHFLTGLDNITIKRDLFLEQIAEGIVNEFGGENGNIKSFQQQMTMLPETENGKILSARLENFQKRFGYIWADRYPRDPGWEFSKQKLVLSLKEFGSLGKRETLQKRTEEFRARREKTVIQFEEQLSRGIFSGVKLRIWRSLLKDVETFYPYKEQRNDHLYSIIMTVRSLGREIGKRSFAEGIIDKPNDIFFLTAEEIIRKDNVDGSLYWWKNLIENRRAKYEQSSKSVEFEKSVTDRDSYSSLNQSKKEMFGDGCSPGLGMGIARVIKGMGELDRICDGEILFCTSFRPAMSPVLSRIGGLIVERGSVISHGAILSREYGVPAVFNIKNITSLVTDGDKVSLDGNTGIVKLNSYETLDHPS